jgi:hypothetical protein
MFPFGIFMRSNLANPLSVGEAPASAFGPRINISFTMDELDEFNTDVPNHNPGKGGMIIFHELSIKSPAQIARRITHIPRLNEKEMWPDILSVWKD